MCGLSGVVACAALLPDLVTAAAALASYAPNDAEGLDWSADMGPAVADTYRLVLTDPAAARAMIDQAREEALATPASDLAQLFAPFLAPADAAVLTGKLDDACAQVHPWGFELADISVPVLLVHGRQDKFVSFAHGQRFATHIPGVEARLLDDDGHLTLQQHRVSEVHSWLSFPCSQRPARSSCH